MVGRRRPIFLVLALLAGPAAASPGVVDARAYDSFWLWAGVRPQPVLDGAARLYLLDAEVEEGSPVRLVSRRPALPHVAHAEVWLVVRAGTLSWPPAVYAALLGELARWRAAGNRVAGIQVDFDAHTRRLAAYAGFLRGLRNRLPPDCRLGVTGLLDWSANGDPRGLADLAGTVDEIVLQTYQGRHVIPGYADYLGSLDRMTVPFRIGLVQGGPWDAPASLAKNPMFRGYVVFLLNDPP